MAYDCIGVNNLLDRYIEMRSDFHEKFITGNESKDLREAKVTAAALKENLKTLKEMAIPTYINANNTPKPRNWNKGDVRWTYASQPSQRIGELEWDAAAQEKLLEVSPNQTGMKGSVVMEHAMKRMEEGAKPLDANVWRFLSDNPEHIPQSWKTPIDGKTPYVFFFGTVYTAEGKHGVRGMHYNAGTDKWDFKAIKALEDEDWGPQDVFATLNPDSAL